MNRLILIGNGFDLAHGLKTSYVDFVNWYWEEWGRRLAGSSHKFEEDDFCSFAMNEQIGLDGWYLVRGYYFRNINLDVKEFVKRAKNDTDLCEFRYKSPFLEQINKQIESKRWVDVENEYYELLTQDLRVRSVNKIVPSAKELNIHLGFLREKLIEYLKLQNEKEITLRKDIDDKIYRPIKEEETDVANNIILPDFGLEPSNIMLLNFNYTSTPELYMGGHSNVTINYIHGRLDEPNSVIFGYGDELDKEFSRLKELNDNEYLRYVKSINYLEADNYRRLLEFIESEPFQIVIMGHSCGNPDRTLLNTLFEHQNCISIKPYYYINDQQEDNYLEIVQNIYRNFTNLQQMRARVVNKAYTEALTNPIKQ